VGVVDDARRAGHRATLGIIDTGLDAVTGAFSYSGAAIASRLSAEGRHVRTLTGHPDRAPDASRLEVRPLDFEDLPGLVDSLRGVTTLYNTYWVRFAKGGTTHETAVANSCTLFNAARRAGVQRIVHLSITHADVDSPYPYFRGKARVERMLAESDVSFAVLRPAILFGGDGVLINNIAWLLRHVPVFVIGGDGTYRVRGIHIDDLAELAVRSALGTDDTIVDAVGPQSPTFEDLVAQIQQAVGSRAQVLHLPGVLVPPLSRMLGLFLHDVLLTADEYRAMSHGLAHTDGPTTGMTAMSTWITDHADTLGRTYANDIERHFS
jgi:NADH dehydrogenase